MLRTFIWDILEIRKEVLKYQIGGTNKFYGLHTVMIQIPYFKLLNSCLNMHLMVVQ